jgi:hypothetical protein
VAKVQELLFFGIFALRIEISLIQLKVQVRIRVQKIYSVRDVASRLEVVWKRGQGYAMFRVESYET